MNIGDVEKEAVWSQILRVGAGVESASCTESAQRWASGEGHYGAKGPTFPGLERKQQLVWAFDFGLGLQEFFAP